MASLAPELLYQYTMSALKILGLLAWAIAVAALFLWGNEKHVTSSGTLTLIATLLIVTLLNFDKRLKRY